MRLLILDPDRDATWLVRSALPARAWRIDVVDLRGSATQRLPRTQTHRPPWAKPGGVASRIAGILRRPPSGAPAPAPVRRRPVPWLVGLIDRLAPDVIYTPSLVTSAALAVGARSARRGRFPPWLSFASGRDVTTELLDEQAAERVAQALAHVDGLVPRSVAVGQRAVELGFVGRLFEPVAPAVAFDLARLARPRRPAELRRTILVDGRHDVADRALVAIAGLAACADDLAGHDIAVINATDDVAIAAELLATDTGLRVTVVPVASRRAVLDAHAQARISIRLSLVGDVDWWEVAAMASGALPVLSQSSVLGNELGEAATAMLVDPDDPAAVGEAVRPLVTDDEIVRAAGPYNAALARRRFAGDAVRATMRHAITTLADER